MIRLDQISVVFSPGTVLETKAINQLSLSVLSGEFITVVGSNGAGKSTLMEVLSGEVQPISGRVYFQEQDVTQTAKHIRAQWVGRVFQDPRSGTLPGLTIEENLALALQRGKRRGARLSLNRERRELFRERLAALGLGLEQRLSDKMDLLSGGQRQTVALVMATLSPSRLLLLDEHTAALDPRTAAFVLELTENFVKTYQLTTLMVTHKMSDALNLGQRTIMLHQGRIVLDIDAEQRKKETVQSLVAKFGSAASEEVLIA